jgi:hypothetical protein
MALNLRPYDKFKQPARSLQMEGIVENSLSTGVCCAVYRDADATLSIAHRA